MKEQKKIEELKSYIPQEKYHELVVTMVKWICSLELPLILVTSNKIIESEDIKPGGKVTWDPATPHNKRPKRIYLNGNDFNGIRFLAIFLHECGHVEDKDDRNIIPKSNQSEISAWKHAKRWFLEVLPSNEEKIIFFETVKESLASYGIKTDALDTQ